MAIGDISVSGYGMALFALDRACKAGDVRFIGIDSNPHPWLGQKKTDIWIEVNFRIEGAVDDVKNSVEAARSAVRELRGDGEYFNSNILSNPSIASIKALEYSKVVVAGS